MIRYREETNPSLIKAAEVAYREAPPDDRGGRSAFARNLGRSQARAAADQPDTLADQVRRADTRTI